MAEEKLPEGYRWGHDKKGERISNAPAHGSEIHEGDKGYNVEEVHYRESKDKKIKPVEEHPKAKEIRRIKRGG